MKSHIITGSGGIQLHLAETGNQNGQPILFIHGFSALIRMFFGHEPTSADGI
ncbi:MAG: hypothetical protein ACJ8R9_05910 [Steroidobacteraceae bacterium]